MYQTIAEANNAQQKQIKADNEARALRALIASQQKEIEQLKALINKGNKNGRK